jgi:hypothetical protein
MHEKLLKVVRRLQTDYEPYGTVSRDGESDCSCGCRHFAKLAHEVGSDWGICSNPESPRAGLLTFEHQGCAAFSPITLDPSLADSQLRQIIAEASGLLSDRRRERSVTIERPDPSFPTESGEFMYDIRTSYFPKIKGHFPSIFRMEWHENGFVAVQLEAKVSGKERPVVIARATAKNGEVFKIVRESGDFSYQVPFDGTIYNLKEGDLCRIGLPDIEALRHFLECVEREIFEKITARAASHIGYANRNLEESRDRVRRWRQKEFRSNEIPANARERRERLKEEEDEVEQGPTRIVEAEALVEWLGSIDRSNPRLASIPPPQPPRAGRR